MNCVHVNTELLIDFLQGCLEEEGYETKRYSDGKKYYTSAYDCIVVKGNDGNFYEITISECDDIKRATEKYTEILSLC